MSAFILDASVTAVWLFDDENEPRADAALTRLGDDGAIVPHLWHLEVRNCLLAAERQGRLSGDEVKQRLDSLRDLPIRTEAESDLDAAFVLAKRHGLSFYDALYLELAQRHNAALATLDTALARATLAAGLSVVEAA